MIRIIQFAAAVALTLTLAACGGDDDSALRDQIAMLEMERDEATTARMTAEGQVADLQAEVTQLESEIAMLMGRADISAADLATLRSEAETLRGQLAGRADISPENLAVLRSEIGTLRAEVARLTDEKMAAEMEQQARLDAQDDAGLGDGLARSIAPPVYAASDADTLANLLPGGQAVFAPLSASVHRSINAWLSNHGAAYMKAISSDGQGGFNVTWTIDGIEIPIHFAADAFSGSSFDHDEGGWYSMYGFTDAFYPGPGATEDRTDGSSQFDYLDLVGWNLLPFQDGTARTGFSTFGARTMPGSLPTGSVTYEGYMAAQLWESNNSDFGRGGGYPYLQGNLTLEADLSDMVLSGQIDGIYIPGWSSASGENEPLEGSAIAIQSTGIGNAEFMTSWVGSGPVDATRDKTLHGFEGTVVGEFYGPAAEEVGGVLSGVRHGMEDGSDEFLVGGFGAVQPNSEQ